MQTFIHLLEPQETIFIPEFAQIRSEPSKWQFSQTTTVLVPDILEYWSFFAEIAHL